VLDMVDTAQYTAMEAKAVVKEIREITNNPHV
jgi:hypothetical protein